MAELMFLRTREGMGETPDKMCPTTELRAIALVPPDFTFDTAATITTYATWVTEIIAKNAFIIDEIISQEQIKVEDGKMTTPFGQIIRLWEGMRGLKIMAKLTLDQHKIVRTYADLGWRLIRLDRLNNIICVRNADLTCTGFELDTFIVEGQTEPTASEAALTPITFQEADPGEYNSLGLVLNPSWRTSALKPMTKVTITSSTVAAFTFTVVVKWVATSKADDDGTAFEVACSGLLAANFELTKADGTSDAVDSATEADTLGTYVIVGTAITDGTVTVVPSSTAQFESDELAVEAAS